MGKRILITGGTGFIGQSLVDQWIDQEHSVTVLTRRPKWANERFSNKIHAITDLKQAEGAFDWLINLAGEGIADEKWNEARKNILRESRIGVTNRLSAWAKETHQHFDCVISGSAVGVYGSRGAQRLNEHSPLGDDFAAQLCKDWETAANGLEPHTKRLVIARTGLVLGSDGGMLNQLWLPFKLGLGGVMGKGNHYMPWIHKEDYLRAIHWLLNSGDEQISGAFNITSPIPVTNAIFTRALGKALKRPTFLPMPKFVIDTLFGEMGELLLTSQRVEPERLELLDFVFKKPEILPALRDIVRVKKKN